MLQVAGSNIDLAGATLELFCNCEECTALVHFQTCLQPAQPSSILLLCGLIAYCTYSFNLLFHAFQSANQVLCTKHSTAVLQPAMS